MADFILHTKETAPQASGEFMDAATAMFGFLPNLLAVAAEAPALVEGYTTLSRIFGQSSLSKGEQQLVLLSVSRINQCHYCMAAHTGGTRMAGVDDEVIAAVREDREIADPRLQALRKFAQVLTEKRGWADDGEVEAFLAAGFTKANVLEIVVGCAVKLMSNYTNHLADTPLDDGLKPMAWEDPDAA